MKVSEVYDFDLDELLEQADLSPYYEKVYDFVSGVYGLDLSELSEKQKDWLGQIAEYGDK